MIRGVKEVNGFFMVGVGGFVGVMVCVVVLGGWVEGGSVMDVWVGEETMRGERQGIGQNV